MSDDPTAGAASTEGTTSTEGTASTEGAASTEGPAPTDGPASAQAGGAADVRVPGLEPTFRHVEDVDVTWQQVKAIRNADGSVSSVWEKWLAFSPDPQYLSLYAKWDPGVVVRRHGHYSPHVLFVIEGEMWCGERHCPAGTHIELPFGAAFGPFVAGPAGTLLLEVMMGDPRSWGDDPDAFRRALEARGAQALDDPPIELPEWLADLRSRWVVDGEVRDG